MADTMKYGAKMVSEDGGMTWRPLDMGNLRDGARAADMDARLAASIRKTEK